MAERHSGYAKVAGDKYYTPNWVTDVLMDRERFVGPVLEAAAGDLGMALRLEHHLGFEIDYTEISEGLDFFDVPAGMYRSIITNPPYSGGLAVRFIAHALAVTKPVMGKVAMLLPHGFDSGKLRRDLFGECPAFAAKHVLTDRIRWTNLEQKKQGPSKVHTWCVWDWANRARAVTTYVYDADPEAVARKVAREARALRVAACRSCNQQRGDECHPTDAFGKPWNEVPA